MDLLDEDPDLELHPREYVCAECHLIHWGPPGPCQS